MIWPNISEEMYKGGTYTIGISVTYTIEGVTYTIG